MPKHPSKRLTTKVFKGGRKAPKRSVPFHTGVPGLMRDHTAVDPKAFDRPKNGAGRKAFFEREKKQLLKKKVKSFLAKRKRLQTRKPKRRKTLSKL